MHTSNTRTAMWVGLLSCLFGLTLNISAEAADTLKLRVADSFPPTHYISVQITQWWMDQIKERTHGAVDFEYFPAEQLGKAKDLLSLTQSGVVDVGYVAPAFVSEKLPLSAVAELPLNFATSCQGSQAYYKLSTDGIIAKQEFEPNGVRALFSFVLPPYQVFLRKKLDLAAGSLTGLKIRTTGGAKELMLRAMGAVPIQIASPDVYQALSRGTIDGMLFPYGSIFSYDVQDLIKTASVRSNFGSFVVTYMISEKKWQSLSPDIRKVITELGHETVQRACAISQRDEDDSQNKLKARGLVEVDFSAEDRSKIEAITSKIGADWARQLDQRGKPGTATLKEFQDALK